MKATGSQKQETAISHKEKPIRATSRMTIDFFQSFFNNFS